MIHSGKTKAKAINNIKSVNKERRDGYRKRLDTFVFHTTSKRWRLGGGMRFYL